MEHEDFTRGSNIGMTHDERRELTKLIEENIDTFHNSIKGFSYSAADVDPAIAYVNQLLAAKDARIAELESRQITPEMIDVWEELQEMKRTQSARFVANNQANLRSDLWHAFVAMMDAREGGDE